MFKFLGILFGVAIRTKKPLDLHLAPCVWKLLVGTPLKVEDIEEVGRVEEFKKPPSPPTPLSKKIIYEIVCWFMYIYIFYVCGKNHEES